MNDKIFIYDLKLSAVIGTNADERVRKQCLIINLEVAVDTTAAAEHDDLTKSIDYEKLVRFIINFVDHSSFQLIETLANRLANNICEKFHVSGLILKIQKPEALAVTSQVGVIIRRGEIN